MASNMDDLQEDFASGRYPLIIIDENETRDKALEANKNFPPRGGSRRGRASSRSGRGGSTRGSNRQSFERRGNDMLDETESSDRGRGRGRERKPHRGGFRGRILYRRSIDKPEVNEMDDPVDNVSEQGMGNSRGKRQIGPRGMRGGSERGRGGRNDRTTNPDDNIDGRHSTRGFKEKHLSENKLIELSKSKEEPDELLLEIDKVSIGFKNLLQKQLDPNLVYYVIRILSIVSRSTQIAHLRDILKEVDSHMLQNLTDLLCEVGFKDHKCESLWNVPTNLEKFLLNIITIIKQVMVILNPSLGRCMSLISAIRRVKDNLNVDNIEQELSSIERLFQTVKESRDLKEKEPKKVLRTKHQALKPPNSFREIPIFPELSDLQMDERPFLRANKVHGKYDDLETYLDVQFRLLREDYIQPLRKGISEYRDCVMSGGNVRKIRELKLYNSVKIMYPVCSGNGINHVIQFDISPFKTMRWGSSRRLLHGSLLCLSNDAFDTILYATVTGRDETELTKGNLEVHFENVDDLLDKHRNETFVMAETSAYFEAYRYILEGLHEINDDMPFKRYLVNCETAVKPPKYLLGTGGPQYDFTSLALIKNKQNVYPVLNTRQWPEYTDLGLDSSQYRALQTAITKELAIIQGPPGTGKTFVGLKIAELLLDNQKLWKTSDAPEQSAVLATGKKIQKAVKRTPLLVVCYTNHALDQFLAGILEIGNTNIIRIGGRCKNEAIEPYVLRKVKERNRENMEGWRLSENNAQCRKTLKECEEVIDKSANLMKKSETTILPYNSLLRYMTEAQQEAFESSHAGTDLQNCFPRWLGMCRPVAADTEKSEELIYVAWEEYIINEVNAMSESELQCVDDVHGLEPIQKAELYKAWLNEVVSNVNDLMKQDQLESKQQFFSKEEGVSILNSAKSTLLETDSLIKYVSKDIFRKQLMSLRRTKNEKHVGPVRNWISWSINTSSIKKALEVNIDRYKDEEVTGSDEIVDTEDIEEERQLDDEDEYSLKMKQKAKKDKKSKTEDDHEWISTWNDMTFSKHVQQIIHQARRMTQEEASQFTHVLDLSVQERRDLYAHWVERFQTEMKNAVKQYEKKFNDATEKLQEVRNMETVQVLNDADVVGMTTTGAAKYRKILKIIRPKIIIVEEAAEVLESHIITTLNESCQHLILIGDHKQLRPSTAVYALAKKYHMDISLFERMVCNNVPCITLEWQHRMRPEISQLLTDENLYPDLRNHPSVLKFDDIKGVVRNFQFITHEFEEFSSSESTSYSNPHEAKYLAKLCRYLLNQGYKREQISVITPYMGQVLLLRKEMPKSDFEGVRITAIDNFQGEENDIILLSLVRSRSVEAMSETRNLIGFVGIENRICVSLSRAKKGFYVIGNFRLLENYSNMWARMITKMNRTKSVRTGLRLRCQNHPDTITFVQTAEDFKDVPEGGCNLSCNTPLSCGHICPLYCHPVDKDHQDFKCFEHCEKTICKFNHKCKKRCYEPCGDCITLVEKVIPMCGHTADMACSRDPYTWKCSTICDFLLPCGHKCGRRCSVCTEDRDHEQNCQVMIKRILECGHEGEMKCHSDPAEYQCEVKCKVKLKCGHKCNGNCGKCFAGRIHYGCNGTCGKILPCGHKCTHPCGDFCPPCRKKCEFSCSHGQMCDTLCYKKCNDCFDTCKVACKKHKITCTQTCNEICDITPCQELCNKELACKRDHGRCRGICGEKCFCIICQKDKIRLCNTDNTNKNAIFIQLPNCSCILNLDMFREHINKQSSDRLYKSCPYCEVAITSNIRPFTSILKTTRENIVRKNEQLFGITAESKANISELKKALDRFSSRGLPKNDIDTVIKRLRPDNSGAVLFTSNMQSRLIKYLDIKEFMESSRSSVKENVDHVEGIVNIFKLRDMLLRGRHFVTKQFWDEVDCELGRIKVWVKYYALNERLEVARMDHAKTPDLITTIFQIITRKEYRQSDEIVLLDAYKKINSLLHEENMLYAAAKIPSLLADCVACFQRPNVSTES